MFVAASAAEAVKLAETFYKRSVQVFSSQEDMMNDLMGTPLRQGNAEPVRIYQDEDVLDTWFS